MKCELHYSVSLSYQRPLFVLRVVKHESTGVGKPYFDIEERTATSER